MSTFHIKTTWPPTNKARDEIEASVCSLTMFLDEKNITQYWTVTDKEFSSLRIPAYYIAEWFAENWWALLFEPRKDDDADSMEFLSRHSLLTAQHGFVLPAVLFVPTGKAVRVHVTARRSQFADAEFRTKGFGDVPRSDLSAHFDKFVSSTVLEMSKRGSSGTPLNVAWQRVKQTTPEQFEFCELVGALGLCPYSVDSGITNAIDTLVDVLGSRGTRDFCLAAQAEAVVAAVHPTEIVAEALAQSDIIDLTPLSSIDLPQEDFGSASWTRGLSAAIRVAYRLGAGINDADGASAIFSKLHVDTNKGIVHLNGHADSTPFVGAVSREQSAARLALLQEQEAERRFAAARAIYLAWVSEQSSRRLVTQAHTRDQQASRQFAAELLVPREYLRSVSVGMALHDEQVREIARARGASHSVVAYQANNSGITILPG